MNIPEKATFTQRGLIIDKKYIISDLHIGYSKEVPSMSIQDERDDVILRIKKVLNSNDIDELILLGDIFDTFSKPDQKYIDVLDEIIEITHRKKLDIRLIKGNHDMNFTNYITHSFLDDYYFNNIMVTHGHKKYSNQKDFDSYIVGHIHPMIKINGVEYPTYLFGYSHNINKNILILPSFSIYPSGTVISKNKKINLDFPYLTDYNHIKPYIYDSNQDTVRELPKFKYLDPYI